MSNSAQIILDWLNDDLSLIPKINDIKKSFYNGYLFGKIFQILNLITEEEFSEFIDSENKEEIESNFISVKKHCKKLFNLIIFDEDINKIKSQHSSAAGVLLYKIRNGIFKLNIHFNNIQFFGSNFSNDEILEQINEIIERQLGDNNEENEKSEINNNLFNENNKEIKESLEEENKDKIDIENINYNIKTYFRKIDINNKEKDFKLKKALPSITTRGFNKLEFKNTNHKNFHNNTNNKLIIKSKSSLAPTNNFASRKKSNSTENTTTKKQTRNLFNVSNSTGLLGNISQSNISTFYDGTFYTGRNDSQLIDVTYFNNNLEKLGINKKDYKIKESKIKNNRYINSFNSTLFQKTRENNNEINNNTKINKTINIPNFLNMKTAEEISKELRNKLNIRNKEEKIKEKNVNFMKLNKNLFNKNQVMRIYFKDHSSDNNIKRINYSKEISQRNEQTMHEKKMLDNFKSLPEILTTRNKTSNNTLNDIYLNQQTKNSIKEFNSKRYFLDLSYQTYSSFKSQCEIKYKKKRKISNKIKGIILYIIDMAMEGYIYQKKYKSEIMDLETFLKFNIYFLKNKRLRKKYIPPEEIEYKRSGKIEQKIDIENLYNNFLNNEDKNYIEDYIYYTGIWNDDIIYDNNLRGIKLDYKYITSNNNKGNNGNNFNNNNYFGIIEYEPTALESEDLTLPNSVPDNYNLGNLLYEIISNNYNIINDNKNILQNNSNLNGKWDYIPYKISLVGYPLSGRKTVAKKLNKIYPNLKIYSMYRIINYYFNIYLQLADPVEKQDQNQVKKKGKKNEKSKENENEKVVKITDKEKESIFERHERQQKFKEMKSIFDALQPYIDYKLNNNNRNKKDICILPDESLCLLLVKKIEEDFPVIQPTKIKKLYIDKQKNIKEIENQIELIKKRKVDAKKQNLKDDIQIEKLENDIKNIKMKSVSGFILTDYPTNVNQCYLLENYLTGFIEEKRQKKNEKDKIIDNTNSIIDYKYQPREKKMDKKSGLNFVVHISTKENIINERFSTAKYDPIEKVLYTGKDIIIEDKTIKDRLLNKIPYLSKELFDYYKDEYNNNINKIINLYSEFGFLVKSKNDDLDFLEQKKEEKMIKLFYYIESENIKNFVNIENKKTKNQKNIKKEEKKEEKKESEIKQDIAEENINKDKVFNFIHNNLIEKLHKENEKYEEEQFQIEFPKYDKKNNNRKSITFEPDLNINEIKTKYQSKSPKKYNTNLKLIDNDNNKINIIIKNLCLINNKYYKNLGIFMHLMNKQKNDIFERFNLIQTKFRDFLNIKNPKKSIIISNFIKRYNNLYIINPDYLNNEQVIFQLNSDIEEVRAEIWSLISKKQEDSIEELNQIKHCSFIEVELIKFYNNIKNLILNETEKFLVIFNNMLLLYNKMKDKENRDINFLIEEFNKKLITNPEIIFKNTKEFKYHLNIKGDVKLDIPLEEVISIMIQNIEIIFKNSIKMLFTYHNQLLNIFRRVKKSIFANVSIIKKSFRFKRKKRKNSEKKLLSASMMNDLISNKDNDTGYINERNVKKIFLEEKNKYKFRLCFIKNYALKYIHIIKSITQNFFENLDDWIVKNVTLQSESLSYLIKILKNILLKEKRMIDEENDINYIELDEFEKVIEEENNKNINKNNNSSNISRIGSSIYLNGSKTINTLENDIKLKPFDNSSVINNRIYNKINLNFIINDDFIKTKIEEIYDTENNKKKNKPKIKIIPSSNIYNSNNTECNYGNNSSSEIKGEQSNLNTKIYKNQKNNLNKEDFYFDIEKYKLLYKYIKKYEVEDGYINQEIFFEIFIRQYLISKKHLEISKRKNTEDSDESFNKNWNININYFYNEEIDMDTKYNIFNNNISGLPIICKALTKLNMKQIKRIYYCFRADIKQFNYIKQNKEVEKKKENEKKEIIKEDKRAEIRKPSKRKLTRQKANDSKNLSSSKTKDKTENKGTQDSKIKKKDMENNINDLIEEEKKEIMEYNKYLNTKEIFTMLSLIGVNLLTSEEEEKIEKDLKNKLIMNKYLTKSDFLEYHFWFESFFNYYTNNKIEENNGNNIIKEFLFDIWKNGENSSYFDFNKFLSILKISKYVTDFSDFNELKYYDVIFH